MRIEVILKTIMAVSLLRGVPGTSGEHSKKFRRAVEFWTETLCTVPNTKTFIFHGIFADDSQTLRNFFEVLLRVTSDHCDAVILLNIYDPRSYKLNAGGNATWDGNTNNHGVNQQTRTGTGDRSPRNNELRSIWKSILLEKLFQDTVDIKKIAEENDEYKIDMWNVNIIFLGDIDSFEQLLNRRAPFEWNRREHFIVLAVWNDGEKFNESQATIESTLKKLWTEHRIQNVFFNEPFSGNEETLMYTYNPFAKINDTAWGKLEIIDVKSKGRMLHLLSTLTYQRTINLNGQRLNISLFEQYQSISKMPTEKLHKNSVYRYSEGYNGTDGILLGTIARHINFAVNVIKPTGGELFGHQVKNGTFIGAVADVVYRRVEACFVSFFVKNYAADMTVMEFTTYVGFDQMCIAVPKARIIPKGFRIYHIFEPYVWFCILVSQIFVCLSWYIVQMLAPRRSQKVDFQATALRAFFANTGYPVQQPSSHAERILLIGILMSGMTIMGTFNGSLYKCFATNMYYKDIDKLTELDESGLPILFSSSSVTDVFGDDDDRDGNQMLSNLRRKLTHAQKTIYTTAHHRNASSLIRKQSFPLVKETMIDKTGGHLLHLMEECPGKYYLSYLLPRNSILRERINVLIGRLNQGGLPALWQRRTFLFRALKMKINLNDRKRPQKDVVPFNLSDVQTCFFVLGMGLLLSSIAFFNEIGWPRRCLTKVRKKARQLTK